MLNPGNRIRLTVLTIFVSFFVSCSAPYQTGKVGLKLYVANYGNDNWSGEHRRSNDSDGPFATMEGARDAIRKLKAKGTLPEGKIIVEVQKGVYKLSGTFELGMVDSGKDSLSPILYVGKKGKEVRVVGGMNLTNWELVRDQGVLEKLNKDLRHKIYQANLRNLGITDFGIPTGLGMELFFNDQPMLLSRYPNKGFMKISGAFPEGSELKGDKKIKLNYADQHINLWKEEKDACVHGYWYYDWSEQRHKISNIDTTNKLIEIAPPYHKYGYRAGQWFYGFNLLSEIDEPGEYYIDRENGILFFYPPSEIEKGKAMVSLNKNMISMNNVSDVVVQGMIFEGCRATAIQILNCDDISIVACTIRNVGDWAVTIDSGSRNSVKDCDIYNVGAGGIRIDAGDCKTLIPAGCHADNNHIHHIARLKRISNPGISLNGVGNSATHNLIEHLPHMAIYFNGNDNLVEYNEVYDVCYESNDAGAVYAGRSWTMRGNIVRYNYLHDISGFENKGCIGVYLDDLFCGTEIYGNIFNRVTRSILVGGGRDNRVINNFFIDCVPALHIDARGLDWYAVYIPEILKEAEVNGTLSGILYDKAPYSTRYPELKKILSDEPAAPKGNIISFNICFNGNWNKATGFWKTSIEKKALPYLIIENNVVSPGTEVDDRISTGYIIADPLFSNPEKPEKGKFKLNPGSPALKIGIKQIPFNKIGLYKNGHRKRVL